MDNTKNNNTTRFLLTFFLGWIGSIIINSTNLKPTGFKSRTLAYVFLSVITGGIYGLVASIANLSFDPQKSSNIGYAIDSDYVEYVKSKNGTTASNNYDTTELTKQSSQTKTLLKKIIILGMAFMCILTFVFDLVMIDYDNFYILPHNETGFTFLHFASNLFSGPYSWATYLIGSICIVLILIALILFIISIISILRDNTPKNIIVFMSLAIAIFYNILGIILTIRASIIFKELSSLTTSYIPMLIQLVLFTVYKSIDKFSFNSSKTQSIEFQNKKQPISGLETLELLEKYAELKEKNILSEEEFQTKKKDLLC